MQQQRSQALIQKRIAEQLGRKSTLEYELTATQQKARNLEALIAQCDSDIGGLERARSVMAEMEQELAASYAQAAAPQPPAPIEYEVNRVAAPPPEAQAVAQPSKRAAVKRSEPAKRRGRPPGRKKQVAPEPMHDEPTHVGGGGMTPEQAAAE